MPTHTESCCLSPSHRAPVRCSSCIQPRRGIVTNFTSFSSCDRGMWRHNVLRKRHLNQKLAYWPVGFSPVVVEWWISSNPRDKRYWVYVLLCCFLLAFIFYLTAIVENFLESLIFVYLSFVTVTSHVPVSTLYRHPDISPQRFITCWPKYSKSCVISAASTNTPSSEQRSDAFPVCIDKEPW